MDARDKRGHDERIIAKLAILLIGSTMTDQPRAKSVLNTIRPFRWRIAFTYTLTVIEDLLELSYPWATGLAINGLLAQDYRMIAPVMVAWLLHTAIGCGRQMYDTRLYTQVYNTIVVDTVLRQRQSGIESTKVAARSAMSREFVTFFEKDMPVLLNTLVTIVGSAAILFYYDLVMGALAVMLFIPVAIINRNYMKRSLALNEGLNNQLEHEVQIVDAAQEECRRPPFRRSALLARQALRRRCASTGR